MQLPVTVLVTWRNGGHPYVLVVDHMVIMFMLWRLGFLLRITFMMNLSDCLRVLVFRWHQLVRHILVPPWGLTICGQVHWWSDGRVVWWFVSFGSNCWYSATCSLFCFPSWLFVQVELFFPHYYISTQLSPLEAIIRHQCSTKLVPHPPSDLYRDLFELPVRFGGLGVCIPADFCNQQYQFSKELLHGAVALLLDQ